MGIIRLKKMFKQIAVTMLLICGMFVQSKSECNFYLETFSDSSCSTSTGGVRYSVEMCKCFPSHAGGHDLKVDVCNPSKYVLLSHYLDDSCTTYSNPPVHGLMSGYCVDWLYNSNTWIKVSDMSVDSSQSTSISRIFSLMSL